MRISDWSSDVCSSDLFSIEEHTHTKKGFQMFIAIMGARVERETFAALLDAARALGGWYTKPRPEEHTSELQSLMRISYAVFCLKQKTIIPRKTGLVIFIATRSDAYPC